MILCAIQSCGSSALISISAGIISDINFSMERGSAFGIFYLAFWLVNFIASMNGGYIIQYLNWQWIFYTFAIYGSFIFLLVMFFTLKLFAISIYQLQQLRPKIDLIHLLQYIYTHNIFNDDYSKY
ncbi:hypothetical protein C2G38_2256961 [Gigaspora rosea]|uniref:Major facilitator superfamily (MFS) profile domain-containing protein n=1 Tax=Gigaspora rosea TaxID=44941 RepID=A0A397TU88_9GLOM|nr:hypothetical protein C2G38_2256961 [Gigaspora rosea]